MSEDDDDDDDEESSSEDDSDSEEEEVQNDRGNDTDTANTSITRPDEGTAPVTAPAPATEGEKEAAAITADPLDPVCMFGQSTIPENIQSILDEWHKQHPRTVPPCSYRSGIPKQAWKVFDQNGNELPFSLFMIKRPIPYKITFISNEDGSGKLVSCRPYSPFQIFLTGWNGLAGYDEEACAVRLFARNLEDIVFTPGCFDKARRTKPEAVTTSAAANGTSTEKDTTKSHKRGRQRDGRTSDGSTTRSVQQKKPENNPISDPASENPSSNESSQSECEDIPARPTKRSRNSTSDAALPHPAAPLKTTSPNTKEVAFKLVSELSDATRCFPITECKSSRDLFAKARKFFRLLDEKLDVNVLSCRIPSKHERRYLFEGSQGEFNLLIHDVRNLQGVGAKTLIIEVKCME